MIYSFMKFIVLSSFPESFHGPLEVFVHNTNLEKVTATLLALEEGGWLRKYKVPVGPNTSASFSDTPFLYDHI